MGLFTVATCVCLSVLLLAVNAQTGPFVQAPPISDNDMSTVIANCDARIASNNTIAHYVTVPSDCNEYAACDYPAAGSQPVLMLCPPGLFFNDDMEVLTCVRPSQYNCPANADPCNGHPDGYMRDSLRSLDLQGAFWNCLGGRAIGGGWCRRGFQFLNQQVACQAIQDRPIPPEPTTPSYPCPYQPFLENSAQYIVSLTGDVMDCSPGTAWSQDMCTCA